MELIKFRVKSFRSISDTGWIDASRVTALIGTNESGKSNLLVALWKLKPVRDGQVDLKADAPRKLYNEIRSMEEKPVFIEAQFQLPDDLVHKLVELTGASFEELQIAEVSRRLDGKPIIGFPQAQHRPTLPKSQMMEVVLQAEESIGQLEVAGKTEVPLKEMMLASLKLARETLENADDAIDASSFEEIKGYLQQPNPSPGLQKSVIVPTYQELLSKVEKHYKTLTRPSPSSNQEARNLVWESIPWFVYYTNYGNLDSEIYLPHVIANLKRNDLGSHEAAKARTLRVLFEFVRLSPEEILSLGEDIDERIVQATPEKIHEVAEHKKEREILLQSASTSLTTQFLDWWQQGNYRFRLQADGKHFRIWVADQIRPEEIELEGRSTGLQWFLSFFLVFLVERQEAHKNTILLLDEPGVSLHPVAQADLFRFFNNLSRTNQIFYTAHSPFMVNPDYLDRVRAVYFDESGSDKGLTKVSADLRAKEKQLSEARSVYPVHAALELSVSPVLMVGCLPIIVEGISDQYYLSAIKNYLIGRGLINPKREILFLPSGSSKAIKATIPIITARDEALPYIILDSDKPGKDNGNSLKGGLYHGASDRIIMVGDIVGFDEAEFEDVLPTGILADVVTKYFRGPEEEFSDVVVAGKPVVPQIEEYIKRPGVKLDLDVNWKVEIARKFKERLLKKDDDVEAKTVEMWQKLFERFLP